MWKRFVDRLKCPISGSPLRLIAFREQQRKLAPQYVDAARAVGIPVDDAFSTYVEEGVIHYCITNMPGAVARTSTFALNNATLPFWGRFEYCPEREPDLYPECEVPVTICESQQHQLMLRRP